MKIFVYGATGMVGTEFIKVLEERRFPVEELRLFASQDSKGVTLKFRNRQVEVQTLADECFRGLDLVFFASEEEISREWAPRAVREGAFAIDNSSVFRLNPEIALIVPEVNGHLIPKSN
ncbi:MAG TPA: aspartate-semialdehyde dehydrogenase, partial [Leptospiraceae bacterium]|nr:aspartate-semialdehyde dehydrogenase [Leptospiraceae bacterium]